MKSKVITDFIVLFDFMQSYFTQSQNFTLLSEKISELLFPKINFAQLLKCRQRFLDHIM